MEMFTVKRAGLWGEDLAGIRGEEKRSWVSRCFHFGSAKQTEIDSVHLSNDAVAANASSVSASRLRDVSVADNAH